MQFSVRFFRRRILVVSFSFLFFFLRIITLEKKIIEKLGFKLNIITKKMKIWRLDENLIFKTNWYIVFKILFLFSICISKKIPSGKFYVRYI